MTPRRSRGRRRLTPLGLFAAGVALLAPVGAWGGPQRAGGSGLGDPVNAVCPVMPDEPIDPRFTVEHEGVTIGLCCRKCRTKFERDPAAYAVGLPVSFVQEVAAPPVPHDHDHPEDGSHDHPDDADTHSHDGDFHAGGEEHSHDEPRPVAPETGSSGEDEHDHSHDEGGRSELAVWIGKFHPPATHLPIGLLLGAVVAELGFMATGREPFRHAASFCVTLAAIGATVAASLGWFNGGFVLLDDDWVQATHRWLGTGTALLSILSLVLLVRAGPAKGRRAFRAVLFPLAVLVAAAGFFGGALVHGIDHYAW